MGGEPPFSVHDEEEDFDWTSPVTSTKSLGFYHARNWTRPVHVMIPHPLKGVIYVINKLMTY